MKSLKQLISTSQTDRKLFKNLLLNLVLYLSLLLFQSPAYALQFESVAIRNMNSYKKFSGLNQNALVIKAKVTNIKYLDRFEFATGELTNGEDNSTFISAGPTWRFNKPIARSGLAFFEVGTSPTWISNENFKDESLGGNLFFTSNVQLGMHFGYRRETSLSVRIQHISNGGMSGKNPGTDMVGIEFSYMLGK